MNFRKDVQNLTEAYKQINEQVFLPGVSMAKDAKSGGDSYPDLTKRSTSKPAPLQPKPAPPAPVDSVDELGDYIKTLDPKNPEHAHKLKVIRNGIEARQTGTTITDKQILDAAKTADMKYSIKPGDTLSQAKAKFNVQSAINKDKVPDKKDLAQLSGPPSTEPSVKAQPGGLGKFADWAADNPVKAGLAGAGAGLVAAKLLSKKKKDDDDE